MERLDEWCSSGRIRYREDELSYAAAVTPAAKKIADQVIAEIRRRRILALMLGDTSMGMINGYFGHRLLNKVGFTEHKVDQAWILDRVKKVSTKRVDAAMRFVTQKGVQFHWKEKDAKDFTQEATQEQLRMYLAVLDLVAEFRADCLGWQYQLGLLPLMPPSDFCEGLLNSACRPETTGEVIITSTEADQGNLVPMELMKRILKKKGLHPAVMFHDVRWGAEHQGRFLWVLLNSGSCGAYAFNHDPGSLEGVHSYRQPAGYFPIPGGTFAGESLPGEFTWARSYIREGELWMDIGRGESVKLPPRKRDAWWEGTTRQWPFLAGRPPLLSGDRHGPLHVEPHRARVWRHLRRDGGREPGARLPRARDERAYLQPQLTFEARRAPARRRHDGSRRSWKLCSGPDVRGGCAPPAGRNAHRDARFRTWRQRL
jgi:L-fucose isomerase-like protein